METLIPQFSILFNADKPDSEIPKTEIKKNLIHKRGTLSFYHGDDSLDEIHFFIVIGKIYTKNTIELMEDRAAANYLKIHNDSTFQYNEIQKANYIMKGGAPQLDGKYTVFGEIISGWEVLEKLEDCPIDANGNPLIQNSFTLSIIG